ncbi:hypothetical protein BKA69DRAFT_313671 [Paraphysoderma sedebokerense]|nr:hypothetical protein BKA69DRAFT_313671 [Paraphysoderma sedebokerense]
MLPKRVSFILILVLFVAVTTAYPTVELEKKHVISIDRQRQTGIDIEPTTEDPTIEAGETLDSQGSEFSEESVNEDVEDLGNSDDVQVVSGEEENSTMDLNEVGNGQIVQGEEEDEEDEVIVIPENEDDSEWIDESEEEETQGEVDNIETEESSNDENDFNDETTPEDENSSEDWIGDEEGVDDDDDDDEELDEQNELNGIEVTRKNGPSLLSSAEDVPVETDSNETDAEDGPDSLPDFDHPVVSAPDTENEVDSDLKTTDAEDNFEIPLPVQAQIKIDQTSDSLKQANAISEMGQGKGDFGVTVALILLSVCGSLFVVHTVRRHFIQRKNVLPQFRASKYTLLD